MPGETRADISGWTVDTLHAHVRTLIDERDTRYRERSESQKASTEQALTSASRAVDKAEDIAEKWRQNANEWRSAMSDRDRAYLTKESADARFHGLDKALAEITKRLDRTEGRGLGMNAGWAYLVAAIVAAAAILSAIAAFKIK